MNININKKYIYLLYVIFIVSFIGLWNSDNFKINENFENCPKSYMDKLVDISKKNSFINKNINNYDYGLNLVNLKTNHLGSIKPDKKDKLMINYDEEEEDKNFPKESNYNFSKY